MHKKIDAFNSYIHQLFKTYKLFFSSAKVVSLLLIVLLPIQAIVPLISVQVGQNIIDNIVSHSGVWILFVVWVITTLLIQILPTISLMIQGVLTDKLTGFINITLMNKSRDLKSLNIFDDPKYFDDLQMLKSDASWRPVNLIVFGLSVVQQAITLIAMFAVLSKYNLILSLALIFVMIPQSISYYRIQQDSFETMVTRSKNARKLNYYSSMLLDREDSKEVRLFNMFSPIIGKYKELFSSTQNDVNGIRRKQALISTLYLSLVTIVIGYGFYWFIDSVISGNNKIGVLLLYVSVISYISSSMARIVEDSSLLYDSLLWVDKFYNFINFKDSISDGKQSFPKEFNALNISNVSFKYPFSEKYALNNITFSVNRGERIAIVGENGSGKSTLVKLLMRFYDVTKGNISIDGLDVSSISIEDYRDNMSATFQDFSKFKLSLGENVSAAKPYSSDKVMGSLNKVGLKDFLVSKNINLETVMSKEFVDGTDASGGQWQKIALARDLYNDGMIEFLDEPTSALDPRSELELYETFLNNSKGKTIFFVTHRLSAVQYADRVLFMKNGSISGFDSHENLLQENEEYADLYNIQKNSYK